VPIRLPNTDQREADRLARKFLGEPHRQSVFPSPIRPFLKLTLGRSMSS
jgi:predicted RNase H-like nuclease